MRTYTRLLDVFDRAENGAMIDEMEWDMRLVPQAVSRLIAEYDLKMKPVSETIVNQDDNLADRLYQAGLALAEQVGVYCISTNRQITFSRDEILASLEVAPVEVTLGEGNDRHVERKRRLDDPQFPTIKGGRGRHTAARGALPCGHPILCAGAADRHRDQLHAGERLWAGDPQPLTLGGAGRLA